MNMTKLFAIRKGDVNDHLVTYTICFRKNEESMFTDSKGCTYIKEDITFIDLYNIVEWEDDAEAKAWQEFDWLTEHDASELAMIFDNLADGDFSDITQEMKANCKFVATWFKRAIYDGVAE